jgi:hypothetical protein
MIKTRIVNIIISAIRPQMSRAETGTRLNTQASKLIVNIKKMSIIVTKQNNQHESKDQRHQNKVINKPTYIS